MKPCECGCGNPAPISKWTDKRRGAVRGQPVRFIRGHGDHPNRRAGAARENARRTAILEPRRRQVAELYRLGRTHEKIAEAVGASVAVVNQDVRRLQRAGEVAPRNIWTREYLTPEITARVAELWDEGQPCKRIAREFGWSYTRAQIVTQVLQRAGVLAPHQSQVALNKQEQKAIRREFKKQPPVEQGCLGDPQKVLLRLLQATARPLRAGELGAFSRAVGVMRGDTNVTDSLRRLNRRGLVERVTGLHGGREKWFWFIPAGIERSTEELTLADAKRETELAALIEQQERESSRTWVETERGHWNASLDAPLNEHGWTLLEQQGECDSALERIEVAA